MEKKIPVGILGATGTVGQRLVSMLEGHPWFETAFVAASERSAGKAYAEAARWQLPGDPPPSAARLVLGACVPEGAPRLVFSALDSDVAGPVEEAFAKAGHIVATNSRNHRMRDDVPLVVPEVNAGHLSIVKSGGAILANPNCSTIGVVLALKPLHDAFGVEEVLVTTMQAISGAGYPGVPSLDILDNVVPYIGGEEEKLEEEIAKILGRANGNASGRRIDPAAMVVSATCARVPVSDGHTASVSVRLGKKAGEAEVMAAFGNFRGAPEAIGLPTSPERALEYRMERDRPQPKRDRDAGRGMTVSVGRLRPCKVLDWKFVVLSHNTVRGAAGGTLLLAELAKARGLLD